jgi:hypothetical protein
VTVAVNVTLLAQVPETVFTTISPGQVMLEFRDLRHRDVKGKVLVLPLVSVAVQSTWISSFAKVEPLAGRQTTDARAQLSSLRRRGQVTTASTTPASVSPEILVGR